MEQRYHDTSSALASPFTDNHIVSLKKVAEGFSNAVDSCVGAWCGSECRVYRTMTSSAVGSAIRASAYRHESKVRLNEITNIPA